MPDPKRWADGDFYLLRGLVTEAEQQALALAGAEIEKRAPFVVPRMRDGTPFRCSVTAAGEAIFLSTPARGYHYLRQHPVTYNSLPEIPRLAHVLGHRALLQADVGDLGLVFDTMLVNRYEAELGESLGLHVDEQEDDLDEPLVSISLGADCEFLIGSTERDFKPDKVLVSSGDVLVLSGAARMWHHGVRRVMTALVSPLPRGRRDAYLLRRVFRR